MISSGVALASHGELRFNLIGFLVQAAAVGVSTLLIFHPFLAFFGCANRPGLNHAHSSKLRVS